MSRYDLFLQRGQILQYVSQLVSLASQIVTSYLNQRTHGPDALLEHLVKALLHLRVLQSARHESQAAC